MIASLFGWFDPIASHNESFVDETIVGSRFYFNFISDLLSECEMRV